MAKWEGGRSPNQQRRFERVKPAVTAAKAELEARYDDTPEEFYKRLFAGLSPEDLKFITQAQQGIEPARKFGGENGLMSLTGYGTGDNRATISRYRVADSARTADSEKDDAILTPSMLGYYLPRGSKTSIGSETELSQEGVLGDTLLEFYPGDKAPLPGAGIGIFDPDQKNLLANAYRAGTADISGRDVTGLRTNTGIPSTLWHELTHRGFDSPALDAYIKEATTNRFIPRTVYQKEVQDAYETLRANQDHNTLSALDPAAEGISEYDKQRRAYKAISEGFSNWLTPEQEALYGVTRVHSPEEKTLDEMILDLVRSK
jgi:hypothetical protein